jgi:hypothetical protein
VPGRNDANEGLVQETVAAIRTVPDRFRHFTVDWQKARRHYFFREDLLTRLLDSSMPHVGTGTDRRFDPLDLENAGLALRLNTPRRTAMRWWRGEMAADQVGGERLCDMRIAPELSVASIEDVILDERVMRSAVAGSVDRDPQGVFELQVRLDNNPFYFDPEFAELFAEVSEFRFHLLPEPLEHDLGYVRQTGLADCRLATHFLVGKGRERGICVRSSDGLFLAGPYGTSHTWIELRIDDVWIPADPFFLRVLAGWGFVDPAGWPALRSPRFVLWRLDSQYVPLLRHLGQVIPTRAAISSVQITGGDPTRQPLTPSSDKTSSAS